MLEDGCPSAARARRRPIRRYRPIADQVAGKGLGDLDPALYAMESAGSAGLVDVTSGNNSFNGVTGYTATPGYDMASGIGTVNAAEFVPALVTEVEAP